ncbi:helix-turn-helix domain-containing protein [Acinetobacter vivianii]|uniref:helix-turn-helix domain-containing protein n=1 Tax=Acinetobacter vivianii TaxID=1776742 RepID=UPI003D051001
MKSLEEHLKHPFWQKIMNKENEPSYKEVNEYLSQFSKMLCTNHTRLYGYMFYLLRKSLRLSQTEMGYLLKGSHIHKTGFTKSAYSKIENGQVRINFDLIFILSVQTGQHFDKFYNLYSTIIRKANINGCYFIEPCGVLFNGTTDNNMFDSFETSVDYWYTDIKDYSKFFKKEDLEEIKNLVLDLICDIDLIRNKLGYNKKIIEIRKNRT